MKDKVRRMLRSLDDDDLEQLIKLLKESMAGSHGPVTRDDQALLGVRLASALTERTLRLQQPELPF